MIYHKEIFCVVPTCPNRAPENSPMCAQHWRALDSVTAKTLLRSYHAKRFGLVGSSECYADAIAIAARQLEENDAQ